MSANASTKGYGSKTKKISELNRRQRLFVREYLIDYDQQAAYTRAGYTGTGETKRVGASVMMKTYAIKAAIDEEMSKREKRLEIDADKIMDGYAKFAFDDHPDFKNPKHENQIKALDSLAKCVGLFSKKVDVNIQVPNLILERPTGLTIEHEEELRNKILRTLPDGYELGQENEEEEKEGQESKEALLESFG